MWFRNLQLYRLPKGWADTPDLLEQQLATMPLQACATSAMQSIGWVAPRPGGPLIHAVNRQWLIALGAEQRLLPASVVKQFADDRAKDIEEKEGRKVGRKEMRELREAMSLELMPRAFVRRRTTFGWIDPVNGWLIIDAASPAKAEELLEHLRKSVDSLPARLVDVEQSPSAAMTGWVAAGEAPASFTLDQDLELRSAENATVRYVKHTLEGDEIRQHIATGKVVTRLAMTWGERISFLLNENLQIKRLAFLDILKDEADGQAENEDERFDIDFTLMSGEVARLLDDLLAALGGEVENQPEGPPGRELKVPEASSSALDDAARPAPWFVYLIECADGSIYTGIALDVAARYAAHASGRGARYTRAHPPARLLATVAYPDRSSALKAEYRIKQLKAAAKRILVAQLSAGAAAAQTPVKIA